MTFHVFNTLSDLDNNIVGVCDYICCNTTTQETCYGYAWDDNGNTIYSCAVIADGGCPATDALPKSLCCATTIYNDGASVPNFGGGMAAPVDPMDAVVVDPEAAPAEPVISLPATVSIDPAVSVPALMPVDDALFGGKSGKGAKAKSMK